MKTLDSTDTQSTFDSRALLTKREAAKQLRVCVRSVENAVTRKALAVVRLGKRCVRFRPEDLRKYVESRRFKAVGE